MRYKLTFIPAYRLTALNISFANNNDKAISSNGGPSFRKSSTKS